MLSNPKEIPEEKLRHYQKKNSGDSASSSAKKKASNPVKKLIVRKKPKKDNDDTSDSSQNENKLSDDEIFIKGKIEKYEEARKKILADNFSSTSNEDEEKSNSDKSQSEQEYQIKLVKKSIKKNGYDPDFEQYARIDASACQNTTTTANSKPQAKKPKSNK
eukprot:CAMPEP_0114590246 /NCGR_PEP_ID=MMETSP0125-20121206/12532_1 /TAXON_ID=485358 ORGANISM="Aristerostoma sp., Strain ATCC 50986" /NCGR_SAMPLE_ID=MMETSP0125 /ASSEMBLY_ACC=CAM_ASM_000245 /LENGTH=160 /DNA_ID=CAMNT_0001787617 /DNA_START=375 /DNA_END=858 /DNA_ORIENTATION=+